MKYENLSKLIAKIQDKVDEQNYFMARLDFAFDQKDKLGPSTCMIMLNQNGVCRTNCMDCLDRTNAFQAKVSYIYLNDMIEGDWGINRVESSESKFCTDL